MKFTKVFFQNIFQQVFLILLTIPFILLFNCYNSNGENPEIEQKEVMIEIPLSITENNEEFSQLNQSTAILANGGFGTVWVVGNYPNTNIAFQMIKQNGRLFFEEGERLIVDNFTEARSAVIAAHPSSGAFVAFSCKDGNGRKQIVVQYFNETGKPMWLGDGIVAAKAVQKESFTNPQLVPDSSGGVYVCFGNSGTWDAEVRCQHFDFYGNPLWGDYGKTAGGKAGLKVVPKAVLDEIGGLFLFWRNQRNVFDDPNQQMILEGQHFSSDGLKLWGEKGKTIRNTNLAASNGYSNDFMDILPDMNGGVILVFNDWTKLTDAKMDVMSQRVSNDGDLLWGEGKVITGDQGHQQFESLIATGDGGFFVGIYDELNGSRNILRIYRLGCEGQHIWGAEGVRVSHPTDISLDYGLSGNYDATGNCLRLVWTRLKDSNTFDFNLMVARFTGGGKSLDTPGGNTLISAPDAQFIRKDMIYCKKSDLWMIIWDDRRKSRSFDDMDVYAAIFNDTFIEKQVSILNSSIKRSSYNINSGKKKVSSENNYIVNGFLHTRSIHHTSNNYFEYKTDYE